ncbi:MAG: T9SS type A sorting domain-containing protein [Chitinophagales bacterium]
MERKIYLIVILLSFVMVSRAVPADSILLGANAANMVFYKLSNGTKTVASNTDWHIALSMRPAIIPKSTNRAVCIRINGAAGVKLYHAAGKDTSSFSTLDTTGYRTWPQYFDGDTNWNLGAFNATKNFADDFNYGWGEYVISGNVHSVVGDSLFLLQLPDGSLKKLSILSDWKDTVMYFQFANIDNSGFMLQAVSKKQYGTKNFVYYDLQNHVVHDKEPASGDWDLLFTRYTTTNHSSLALTEDMGVLQNEYVSAVQTDYPESLESYYGGPLLPSMNVIGKNFRNAAGDSVYSDRAFFVKGRDGAQYKLQFTAFGGTSNGMYAFNKTLAAANGIEERENQSLQIVLMPNPVHGAAIIRMEAGSNCTALLEICDISGRNVMSQQLELESGRNDLALPVQQLQTGAYVLKVQTGSETAHLRMVVE